MAHSTAAPQVRDDGPHTASHAAQFRSLRFSCRDTAPIFVSHNRGRGAALDTAWSPADGYVIEDLLPDPAAASFAASIALLGCAWSGDVRQTAAWHAERQRMWDAKGHPPPFFSLRVRQALLKRIDPDPSRLRRNQPHGTPRSLENGRPYLACLP